MPETPWGADVAPHALDEFDPAATAGSWALQESVIADEAFAATPPAWSETQWALTELAFNAAQEGGGGTIVDADGVCVGVSASVIDGRAVWAGVTQAMGIAASVVVAVALGASVASAGPGPGNTGVGIGCAITTTESVSRGVGAATGACAALWSIAASVEGVGSVEGLSGATAGVQAVSAGTSDMRGHPVSMTPPQGVAARVSGIPLRQTEHAIGGLSDRGALANCGSGAHG